MKMNNENGEIVVKKIILLFLIIGCFLSFSATAYEFEEDRLMATGICGGYMDESYGNYTNSVTWKLYESGRCVIEGDGRVYNRDAYYNIRCPVCENSWE